MRVTTSLLTAAILILILVPAALADSIQLSVNSNFWADVSSPNDNYWAPYSTANQGPMNFPDIGTFATTIFPNVSVFVPEGSIITGAILQVLLPTSNLQGTGTIYAATPLPPPDWSSPRVAPTFSGTGTSYVHADVDYQPGVLQPVIDGNQVSTGDLTLYFDLSGLIRDAITNPGVNWNGYIGGYGQVDIPYTVQLDVTYSPVPEPSSIALLGTGLLGLAGIARRRLLS